MRPAYVAAIRMMTDPGYRKRLFNPEVNPENLGLTPADMDLLKAMDRRMLDVLAGGHGGKRIQVLEASLPLTVATLRFHFSLLVEHYVAQTEPLPQQDDVIQLMDALSHWQSLDEQDRRFLSDLARAEAACTTPTKPWLIGKPERAIRLKRSPHAHIVKVTGPFFGVYGPGAVRPPADYPCLETEVLVARHNATICSTRLRDLARDVWSLCEDRPTIVMVVEEHGEQARGLVQRWIDQGILEAGA